MRLRVREWRERRLLTQRELAAKVGMTVGTINRIERGANRPRLSTLRRISEALNVEADQLVAWDDDRREEADQ